ncbi:hypothetical protein GUJ93_ZPchr0012g18768 [Zizania palustris]|uniref:Uncharacterized protein n=1 Tax=Zizania palustris TaxID=103762 RepID=A0A8J5WJ23_ZIZPA|nr:hypothetical protein GUJ93_ZPchr0012g18768 [Zizania palustris]
MVEGAEEAQVTELEDLGQVLAPKVHMAEPRDPGQADAEGVQAVEPKASEPEHIERARAIEPEASVATGAGLVVAEEMGPQAAHLPLRASADFGEDFLLMFEQADSPNQYPVVGDRIISVEGPSTESSPSSKGAEPKGKTPAVVVDLSDPTDENHS